MELSAFFDASGSPSTEVVAVAGLVFTPDKRQKFQQEWDNCLEALGLAALHMRDFAHSRGEFATWKDDEPRRRRLINSLLWIVETHVEYTAACGVMIKVYNAANEKYLLEEFMKPYTMAAASCAFGIAEWAAAAGYGRGVVDYLFEKGDNDQDNLRACWTNLIPAFNAEPMLLKKLDSYPTGYSPGRIRAFEAADLIAYENLKANMKIMEGGGSAFMHELRKPVQRMRNLPGSDKWRAIDKTDNLQRVCQMWNIPPRTVP